MKKHSINELIRLYTEAESADQELFAEQRSNLLLISGDHYQKKGSRFLQKMRDNKQLSDEQKIRLTKNHIQRIVKRYVNNIITASPWVMPVPNNESELQDQKAAELNQAVWTHAAAKHKLKKRRREWVERFVGVGEVAVKVYWDPQAGDFQGFEQEMIEGQPAFDELGQPKVSDRPVFTGDLVFEEILGMNLLRHRDAKSMDEASVLMTRKMVDPEKLRAMIGDDKEKLAMIEASMDETYMVFDGAQGNYQKAENQCLWIEWYFRPCAEYPNGYYYQGTRQGVVFEGELPFGIFPIVYAGMDEIPTTPRCRSLVKQLRPYQAEINRASSKLAEHQITLGDDKLVISNGSKISSAGNLPGIRAISVTGAPPTFLAGRDGSQYLAYAQSQIAEMYQVADLEEDDAKLDTQLDPHALLYRSMRQKKKFSLYGEKIEEFLTDLCELYLELARKYFPNEMLIPAIGRREYVNIEEFKSAEKLCYQIKIEPQSDDIETKMGKQLAMNHLLQYVGTKLEKEDIGKIMRAMPYGNAEESFSDMTMDYDNATNEILSLDRGQFPIINKADNHAYHIKRLTSRQRMQDYPMLDPEIRAMYDEAIKQHEEVLVKQAQELQMAQAGFIPTGGYLVVVDAYVTDPANPMKTRRARLPYESIMWLIKKLELQGSTLESFESMGTGAAAHLAENFNQSSPTTTAPGAAVASGAPTAMRQDRLGGMNANGNANPVPSLGSRPAGIAAGGFGPAANYGDALPGARAASPVR